MDKSNALCTYSGPVVLTVTWTKRLSPMYMLRVAGVMGTEGAWLSGLGSGQYRGYCLMCTVSI